MFKKSLYFIGFFFLLFYIYLSFKKPPWHDEIFTNWCAKKNVCEIIEATKLDSSPPLYYIIVHFWAEIFGHSVETIRIFSAILIIFSGFLFVKIIDYFKINILSPFVLIFYYLHPLNFYYGLEARNYALIIFLCLIFVYLVLKNTNYIYLIAIFILLLYIHNVSFLYFGIFTIIFLILKERKILISMAISIVLYLPIFLMMLNQPKESIEWINVKITPFDPLKFFSVLFPFAPQEMTYKFLNPKFLIFAFGIINLFILIYSILRPDKFFKLLGIGLLVYFFEIFIISIFYLRIYFPGRSEVLILPIFLLLLFNFINLFSKNIKNLILISIIVFFMLQNILFVNSLNKYRAYEEVAKRIIKHTKEGDFLIVPNLWYLTLDYYIKKNKHFLNIYIVPEEQGKHPGWYNCKKLTDYDVSKLKKIFSENKGKIFMFFKFESNCSLEILDIQPEIDIIFKFNSFYFCKFK